MLLNALGRDLRNARAMPRSATLDRLAGKDVRCATAFVALCVRVQHVAVAGGSS